MAPANRLKASNVAFLSQQHQAASSQLGGAGGSEHHQDGENGVTNV